jgi:hypothetical protein
MRGDERRVVDAFCSYLEAEGWTVHREVDWVDVVGERGDERLFAEAKGRTAAMGLDIDTMYGQLLRRMPPQATSVRFAVVVPGEGLTAALRVPQRIRDLLQIQVYSVDDTGQVREHVRKRAE